MIKNITYTDKEHLINDTTIPNKNKVTDTDMNEIKNVVNNNAEELGTTNGNVSDLQENKVDKVAGKGLSTNDFTNEYKSQVDANTLARHTHSNKQILDNTTASYTTAKDNKLSGIETGANKTIVDTELSNTSTNPVENKVITERTNELEAENKNLLSAGYKLNGTGENVTLNKTSKNKFVKFGVNGNKKKNIYEGYQLFDKDNASVINGYVIAPSTAIGDNGATNKIAYMKIDSSTTYTIEQFYGSLDSFNVATTVNTPAKDVPITNKQIGTSTGSVTITSGANDNYLVIYAKVGTTTINNLLDYIQVVKGSTAKGNYEPYCGGQPSPNPSYPQEIYAVGDSGSVNVGICNKNFFNKQDYTYGYLLTNETVQTNPNNYGTYIPCEPNTTYTVSKILTSRFRLATAEKIPTSGNPVQCSPIINDNSKTNLTITSRSNDKYLFVNYHDGNSQYDINDIINSLQIEKGSTATEYTPNQSQTYTMPCQQSMVAEEDYFDWDNKKEVHGWKKLVLDGTETYSAETSSGYYRFNIYINNMKYYDGRNTYAISNYFISSTENEYGHIITYQDRIMFYVSENITTVEEFKAWLAQQYANNTPAVVYYKLETAEELNFTTAQNTVAEQIKNATSYYEQTNVYSTDNVSPNFDITAIADLNLLIDPIDARLTLVEE